MHVSYPVHRQGAILHRTTAREEAELLAYRAQFLQDQDALLLELVIERGSSYGQISRLTGLSEPTIRRRFRKLIVRLIRPEPLTVLRSHRLGARQIRVAQGYYLEGRTQTRIIRDTGFTPYFVRKTITQIRRLARVAGKRPASANDQA